MSKPRDTTTWIPKLLDCPPSLLRSFLAFADKGSVSQAAEILELDQPTMSRRLKAFTDRAAGQALLERVGKRRLKLTARGQALLPMIREVVARYEELLTHLTGHGETAETVRVGLGRFAAQLYLPHVLAKVGRQKKWRLETRLVRGRDRILGVAEGRFDLALVTHAPGDVEQLVDDPKSLHIERLAEISVVLIASRQTDAGRELAALPADAPIPLKKLVRWPLVGLDRQSGLRQEIERAIGSPGDLYVLHDAHPGGWDIGREYARCRLGVALLPQPLVNRQDRSDFVLRRLSPAFTIKEYAITRKRKPTEAQNEALTLFREVAKSGSATSHPNPRKV